MLSDPHIDPPEHEMPAVGRRLPYRSAGRRNFASPAGATAAAAAMILAASVAVASPAHADSTRTFYNQTSEPLWGEMYDQCGSHTQSWSTSAAQPILPNGSATMPYSSCPFGSDMYLWGRLCYRHRWWNLPRGKNLATVQYFRHKDLEFDPKLYTSAGPDPGKVIDMIVTDGC